MTYPQLNLADAKGPKATIKTNHGDVTIQLFPDQAPKTVENFITLAKQGYYDGVTFHRVIQPGLELAGKAASAHRLKMNSAVSCLTLMARCQWPMPVLIPTAANSLSSVLRRYLAI